MDISYEIYGTFGKFHKFHMSVRVCSSYDPLKWDYISLQNDHYLKKKCNVDMNAVNDITSMRKSVIAHVVIQFL